MDHEKLDDTSNSIDGAEMPPAKKLPWKMFFILLSFLIPIGFLVVAIPQMKQEAHMSSAKNNLKQIGLALHNYHDVHRTFPPGSVFDVETNEYRHSWITQILPFMDASPLYQQIDRDKPWNHPDQRRLFSTIRTDFMNPAIDHPTVDGYGAAHYAGNNQIFYRNSSVRIRDITDGTSNTVLGGEVSDGFMAWGNPENVRDLADGLDGGPQNFGGPYPGGTHMLFGDGRVRFISKDVDPQILKLLGSPAGSEVMCPEW